MLLPSAKQPSYAERLFEFTPIDRLDEQAARDALCKPAEREGVKFTEGAIEEILLQTQGYPYFLQEWGKHTWKTAETSPIDKTNARSATIQALGELDASFFRVRFDRLTPAEKRYLRAAHCPRADAARRVGRSAFGSGADFPQAHQSLLKAFDRAEAFVALLMS